MRTGSRLLQVVSIILLVSNSIAFLGGVLIMAGFSLLRGAAPFAAASYDLGIDFAALGVFLGIVICIGTILPLIAAILGIKNWRRPDKATPCVVLGIIMLVFSSLGAFFYLFSSLALLVLAGLVLPVLYVVGAFQLKKMNTYGVPEGYPPAGYVGYPPVSPEGYPPAGYGAYPPADPNGVPSAGYDAYPPADPNGVPPPQDPGGYPIH